MYCTYITFYRGNQLPPFYIGYTSVDRISRGYNGSVSSKRYKSIWTQERAAHPHLFRTVILCSFNTRKDALDHEERLLRGLQAHKNDLYINMSIAGKNFTPGPLSEETKKKIRIKAKGRLESAQTCEKKSIAAKERVKRLGPSSGMQGKTHSEESKEKMRLARFKAAQSMTPEQRADRSKRSYATRRLNASRRQS